MNRRAIALATLALLTTNLGAMVGAVAMLVVAGTERAETDERHAELDAQTRVVAVWGVDLATRFEELATTKAEGLTDGRVWVTTLTEEGP